MLTGMHRINEDIPATRTRVGFTDSVSHIHISFKIPIAPQTHHKLNSFLNITTAKDHSYTNACAWILEERHSTVAKISALRYQFNIPVAALLYYDRCGRDTFLSNGD